MSNVLDPIHSTKPSLPQTTRQNKTFTTLPLNSGFKRGSVLIEYVEYSAAQVVHAALFGDDPKSGGRTVNWSVIQGLESSFLKLFIYSCVYMCIGDHRAT